MIDQEERLYIRLSRPNNEYKDGKLVFESSLNMSLNFGMFTCNPKFSHLKNRVYVDVSIKFSEKRLWLVDQLSLRVIAKYDDAVRSFYYTANQIAGCNLEEMDKMDPKEAWKCLCKLTPLEMKYGYIWTYRQYLPTAPKTRDEFYFRENPETKTWEFREGKSWGTTIFEIQIDEWGRPIFRFRPDKEGYPATMECLLSDFEKFLFEHRNDTGEWVVNTLLNKSQE